MFKIKNLFILSITTLVLVFGFSFLFQNCSKKSFKSTQKPIKQTNYVCSDNTCISEPPTDVDQISDDSKTPAQVSNSNSQSSSQSSNQTANQNSTSYGNINSNNSTITAEEGSAPLTIQDNSSSSSSSTSSSSTNPAPVNPADSSNTPVIPAYNITDTSDLISWHSTQDKLNCELSFLNEKGRIVNCTLGGGCGETCGMPSANCKPQYPDYWGVCLSEKQISQLPKPDFEINPDVSNVTAASIEQIVNSYLTPTPSPTATVIPEPPVVTLGDLNDFKFDLDLFYSFSGSTQSECEESVKSSLKITSLKVGSATFKCELGGACGACGIPGANCKSLKPNLYGACINPAKTLLCPVGQQFSLAEKICKSTAVVYPTKCSERALEGSYCKFPDAKAGDEAISTICPAGSFCSGGASEPIQCPENTYCPEGTKNPIQCSAGKNSPQGSALESDCKAPGDENTAACIKGANGKCLSNYKICLQNDKPEPGYYCSKSKNAGRTKVKCPAGKKCAGGDKQPVKCGKNKYSVEGSSDCEVCKNEPEKMDFVKNIIYKSNNTSETCDFVVTCKKGGELVDKKECVAKETNEHLKCKNVAKDGEYCVKKNSLDAPLKCEEGFYCKKNKKNIPTKKACPKGHYCPEGTIDPVACEAGKYNSKKKQVSAEACLPCENTSPKGADFVESFKFKAGSFSKNCKFEEIICKENGTLTQDKKGCKARPQ